MSMHNLPETQAPVVHMDGSRVLTNSRHVAMCFRKEHKHVLGAIDTLVSDLSRINLGDYKFARPEFRPSSYLADNGKQERCYEMNRDAFSLLAMGFQGQKALQFKTNYMEAFDAMEAQLAGERPISRVKDPVARALILAIEEQDAIRTQVEDQGGRLLKVEARQSAIEDGAQYYTVLAYTRLLDLKCDVSTIIQLAKRASALSRERGVTIGSVKDQRFGSIHTYHESILAEVLDAYTRPAA